MIYVTPAHVAHVIQVLPPVTLTPPPYTARRRVSLQAPCAPIAHPTVLRRIKENSAPKAPYGKDAAK